MFRLGLGQGYVRVRLGLGWGWVRGKESMAEVHSYGGSQSKVGFGPLGLTLVIFDVL
jgi:hypothetical protein